MILFNSCFNPIGVLYNNDKMAIIFSNMTKQDYGDHILKVLIYNSWFKRFFEAYLVV